MFCTARSSFLHFICIFPPGLISGTEAERFDPGDALCGAAGGGAPALFTSRPCVNLIGSQRALGVRVDHDERKKAEKIEQTLKTPYK